MAIIKCKMCGGDIALSEDKAFGTCDSCGGTMTLPRISDDRRANLFNRANHFRRMNEFDKAISAYERILEEDDSDAEAHWGIVLSRYGIEYVEDPVSHARIPTCHRVQPTSILVDEDYLAAKENAPDGYSAALYQQEAERIAQIQKGILAISKLEEPYDVFICYKESTDGGSRTKDSTFAQEIYYELTEDGYKVFFARITLEEKLGEEYEPYIFAALNSAKVMVVVGTKPEYFNAVWVKNEWSRFLTLMKKDKGKLLIPCYRDMDPYELPEELAVLQSQDMSKIGFMQDLLRGIKKVVDGAKAPAAAEAGEVIAVPTVQSLLRRAQLFMEDGDFDAAVECADKALDVDPEYAPAYIIKVQAALGILQEADLANQKEPLTENADFRKALRFADAEQKEKYEAYNAVILERLELERIENVYEQALKRMSRARRDMDYAAAAEEFESIRDYRDAAEKAAYCRDMERKLKIEREQKARELQEESERRRTEFERMLAENERRREQERIQEARRKQKNFRVAVIALPTLIAVLAFILVNQFALKPRPVYAQAQNLMAEGQYDEATALFDTIGWYGDSKTLAQESQYQKGIALMADQQYNAATRAFEAISDYSNAADMAQESQYQKAGVLMAAKLYDQATKVFQDISEYRDAETLAQESQYQKAAALMAEQKFDQAAKVFKGISKYKDAAVMAQESQYRKGAAFRSAGEYDEASKAFFGIDVYLDAETRAQESQYQKGTEALARGAVREAAIAFARAGNYQKSLKRAWTMSYERLDQGKISAGGYHTIGITSTGKAVAVGYNSSYRCNVALWSDMVAVSGGQFNTVGLKANGTVVAIGEIAEGQCNVGSWTNIVAIDSGSAFTVGLKSNGTVVAVGSDEFGQCGVDEWRNITAISAGRYHTVGLKADGTVVTAGNRTYGQGKVGSWSDIVAVAAGYFHTVGLKPDGTVVATGDNSVGQCDVDGWTDIVAVAAGCKQTIGLKSDGTVVAVGDNSAGQCNVSGWTDIVAIDSGVLHTVGLKSDGTVVAAGSDQYDQCDVGDWENIGGSKTLK